MFYDVVVNEDYNKACQLYSALVKVNCSKLLSPYCSYLREAVISQRTKYLKYGYRIFKDNNNMYQYVTFLEESESNNAIPLEKFLKMLERTVTL